MQVQVQVQVQVKELVHVPVLVLMQVQVKILVLFKVLVQVLFQLQVLVIDDGSGGDNEEASDKVMSDDNDDGGIGDNDSVGDELPEEPVGTALGHDPALLSSLVQLVGKLFQGYGQLPCPVLSCPVLS